jgi:NitT/TauT family transport system substrate-binding protein
MRFSGHNLSIRRLIEDNNLEGKVNVVEMNPPDMAAAMVAGVLDAYYVGEPFAAQTLQSGHSTLVTYVEDVWPKFICNLVLVRNELIKNDEDIVQELVEVAARTGVWAQKNPKEAARIASRYWNQSEEVVYYALTNPKGRIRYNLYEPKEEEIQEMADMMVEYGLIESSDITGLVEGRFAREANLEGAGTLETIIR